MLAACLAHVVDVEGWVQGMLLKAESAANDEMSLKDLVLLVWRQKILVGVLLLVCTLCATAFALSLPRQYRATVELMPVSTNSAGGRLAGQSASLSDLTSLIGISIGGDSDRYESVAVLESRELTAQYIHDNDLIPLLFPPSRSWVGRLARKILPKSRLTLWRATNRFEKIRNVTEDRRTGIYTLSISWRDPVLAAKWANDLVKLTNDFLRAKAIAVSQQHIDYLKQQAAETDVAEVRTAIYAVLESEIKNVMLAKGPGDYALKVIDPAVTPETSNSPQIGVWAAGGFAVGLFLSMVVLFLRSAWRSDPPPQT